MTDFIHLFMVLEVLIAMQEQNEKESNKDAAPKERKLQREKVIKPQFCCLLQESHFTA